MWIGDLNNEITNISYILWPIIITGKRPGALPYGLFGGHCRPNWSGRQGIARVCVCVCVSKKIYIIVIALVQHKSSINPVFQYY